MAEGKPGGQDQPLRDDPLLSKVPEVEGYKVLEPCVLYAKVGEGGMGAVYRGRHLNLDVDVAIKCLKGVLAETAPSFVTRFQREARIAASVHHQNLVQVYDISEKNGVHYLVMEYVRGETARERVVRKGRLKEHEALKILLGAASGLAEAHAKRIVHRDIKPDNILISYDGTVKVSDLGLAKALEIDAGPSLTMGVMGTPQYMAPEQWEDSATVGTQADVWALGATFYYLLTGDHAVPGGSMQQIYRRICVDPFPDVAEKLPGISAQARSVLERCVKKDPKERFADCRDLVRELAKIVKDAPSGNLSDAGSGTMRVPPLLSPPPAETMGHIRVALQDPGASTQRVTTPATGQRPASSPGQVSPPAPAPTPPAAPATGAAALPRSRVPLTMALVGGPLLAGVWYLAVWRDRKTEAAPSTPTAQAGHDEPAGPQSQGVEPAPPPTTRGDGEVVKEPEDDPEPEVVSLLTPPEPAPAPVIRLRLDDPSAPIVTRQETVRVAGTVEHRLEGKVWIAEGTRELVSTGLVAGTFELQLAGLTEGRHELAVVVEDQRMPLVIECDRTEPVLTPPGQTLTNRARVELRFGTSEPLHTLAVSGAAGAWQARTDAQGSWIAEVELSEGSHLLTAEGVDRAGNTGTVSAPLTVDLTPPAQPSASPPATERLVMGPRELTLAFGEPGLEVRLDGLAPGTTDSAGNLRVEVEVAAEKERFGLAGTARDPAGNERRFELEWPVAEVFLHPDGWSVDLSAGFDESSYRANLIQDPETKVWFRLLPGRQPPVYIGQTELTVGQFRVWPESTLQDEQAEDLPVTGISWRVASDYCKHFGYDLPTREEWTTACLAGSTSEYPAGIDDRNLFQHAWHAWVLRKDQTEPPPDAPRPVKSRSPNRLGLHDMLGNVWELCQEKVKLGGSFSTPGDLCKASGSRYTEYPATGISGTRDTGFRPVLRIRD